jgi:hypothetical protein
MHQALKAIVFMGLLVIAACGDVGNPNAAGKDTKDDTSLQPVWPTVDTFTAQPESAGEETKYLFSSPEAFRVAFNSACARVRLHFEIDELQITRGDVHNTISYKFNDDLGIIGLIDKMNGKMIDLMMVGTGDGTARSDTNIFLCMGTIIAAVDPELPAEERGEIMSELGLQGKDADVNNLSGETRRNGIKYGLSSGKMTGVMFSASRS